jgi:signal transduction histidine kinase
MKLWEIVAAANAVVAVAYFSIAWIIGSGLVRTQQLRSNKLGAATALIFLTCGVHHGTHSLHMLIPSFGIHDAKALDLRNSWHWETGVWDWVTAVVGIYYLSLRGSYASVLRGAQMFEDFKVRQRQAIEINDNIVQGLTVAKYQLDRGKDDRSREAIEETLRKAQSLITELLGERDSELELGPSELRRTKPAVVSKPDKGSK